MAAVTPEVINQARKSAERTHSHGATSHGRGGAGNFGSQAAEQVDPASLETPTIKTKVYTTGRGGTGNMAKNDSPEEARRAQDVTATPRRESTNKQHVGRGGGGNVFRPSKEEIEKAKREGGESAIADDEHNSAQKKGGLLDKAKEIFGGKKSGEEKR